MIEETARNEGKEQGARGDLMSLTVLSHPKFLYVIRSALYPVLMDAGFSRRSARKIVLAVDEACSNIIKYAYEGDHTKTIMLGVRSENGRLVIRLRDFGKQAEAAKIAPRRIEDVRPGGLGTHFMGEVFDRVEYDTSRAPGTVLILEKTIS